VAQLSDMLAQARAKEIEAAENAIAASFRSTAHELSDEMKSLLVPFTRWCAANKVRCLPARPTTIAAYWQAEKDRGKEPYETLLAIEGLHVFAGLANPVQTPIVRSVTESTIPVDAPRSWTKTEKEEFELLPRHTKQVLLRREKDREKTMRRAQNEAAEYKNTLLRLQQADAETKSATEKGSEDNG
jgi:hypothetical protein